MTSRTIETEVAVVGAGIAGLTAASTLAREFVMFHPATET